MKRRFYGINFLVGLLTLLCFLEACSRRVSSLGNGLTILSDTEENALFRMEVWNRSRAQSPSFIIRIINKKHSSNPLRYSSSSLEEYQAKLGNILTSGKSFFKLSVGENLYYPVSCAITPGFGALPVDEIVIGFGEIKEETTSSKKNPIKKLLYEDEYLFKRTLVFKVI